MRWTLPVLLYRLTLPSAPTATVTRCARVSPEGRFRLDADGRAVPLGNAVTTVAVDAAVPVRLKVTAVADAGIREPRSTVRTPPGPTGLLVSRVSSTRFGLSAVNLAAAVVP